MSAIVSINAGSSSVKYALYAPTGDVCVRGQIASFPDSPTLIEKTPAPIKKKLKNVISLGDALRVIASRCEEHIDLAQIDSVAHRVVHGGVDFAGPAIIDADCLSKIVKLSPLAPGHQPAAIAGIEAATRHFPNAVQTASFDTSFHRMQPLHSQLYALPRKWYDKGIRRYGFHGLSYDYISDEMARQVPHPGPVKIVAAHLGSGASLCAINGKRSVATSMGFTALDGLPMATRCGDLDPGALLYLLETERLHTSELSNILYKESGLKGLSGISGDMPTLLASKEEHAREAVDYFVHRIVLGVAEMAAALAGVEAVVFSGGIGENAAPIRRRIIDGLDWLGVRLDPERNDYNAPILSPPDSKVAVHVVHTDEEEILRRDAASLI